MRHFFARADNAGTLSALILLKTHKKMNINLEKLW